MNYLVNKEQLLSAMTAFIPDGEIFQIHNEGEYGEAIISLWDEDRGGHQFFEDFLAQCEISQDADSVEELKENTRKYEASRLAFLE